MFTSLQEHMHLAAAIGDSLRLRSFLSGHVDARDEQGWTALYFAAAYGHLRCMNMLLDAKADVNLVLNGGTSIMVASHAGHLDVVNALIEARAHVNIISKAGQTALHLACLHPMNHPTVATLLAAGAFVDVPGVVAPPLTTASSTNAIESMKLLITAGADVNGSGYDAKPLIAATVHGNLPAAQLLLDAKADVKSVEGLKSSLFRAVQTGNVKMAKLYISAGADVNMRFSLNNLPLTCLHQIAAQCWTRERSGIWDTAPIDYPGVFQVFIDAKADVSPRGHYGITPLSTAVSKNNVEAVNALVAAGANVNDADDNDFTPLMVAAGVDSLGAVTALIAAGADVNYMNSNDGFTALMSAVHRTHVSVVSALVAAGADVNYCNTRTNMSMLDYAVLNKSPIMLAILTKAGAKTLKQIMIETSELVRAVSDGDMQLFNKLVGSAAEEEKNVALSIAVREDMFPMVKCLLAAGADYEAKYGPLSMLIVASLRGCAEIVKELIDARADITEKGEHCMTALQCAAKHKHRDVVALLLAQANKLKMPNK
jgi:ankyrin repeat protein